MTSSEERHEVAERLRELAARTPRDGWMTIGQNARFIEERDYALGIQSMGLRETVQRIADLIDPTCRFLPTFNGGFGCDRCYTWFQSIETKPNYCPSCGAMVVDDE